MNTPTTKVGPTKASHFRFTPDEIARIDAIAKTLAPPGVPVSRITVLRLALDLLEARRKTDRP